jgi:phosphoglycerol transferase MdoB-like AlkP superfamily enzyme
MKKVLTGITAATLLTLPVLALAQSTSAPNVDIFQALDTLTNYLFTILLIVAVIFLIIAAFTFITASGDPDKVGKARNFVLYALIGVAVGVAARGLVALVQTIMGV